MAKNARDYITADMQTHERTSKCAWHRQAHGHHILLELFAQAPLALDLVVAKELRLLLYGEMPNV